ncbi:hypothetical protein BU14_0051s0042 [Porphyra umbilicalis]|uniref:Uncharacterized protein n=1 Tax=Porphyra umbilicalis TaxID=2786 RepID=A0A1X6PI36_PORUM|nr:hypothetical protein BU14_0051s0042 [Porphyra umbilicalis]|eukprot:OSX80522.1 hypothetical protein BU14_0051s0042 [Porphyra umbilicalis]
MPPPDAMDAGARDWAVPPPPPPAPADPVCEADIDKITRRARHAAAAALGARLAVGRDAAATLAGLRSLRASAHAEASLASALIRRSLTVGLEEADPTAAAAAVADALTDVTSAVERYAPDASAGLAATAAAEAGRAAADAGVAAGVASPAGWWTVTATRRGRRRRRRRRRRCHPPSGASSPSPSALPAASRGSTAPVHLAGALPMGHRTRDYGGGGGVAPVGSVGRIPRLHGGGPLRGRPAGVAHGAPRPLVGGVVGGRDGGHPPPPASPEEGDTDTNCRACVQVGLRRPVVLRDPAPLVWGPSAVAGNGGDLPAAALNPAYRVEVVASRALSYCTRIVDSRSSLLLESLLAEIGAAADAFIAAGVLSSRFASGRGPPLAFELEDLARTATRAEVNVRRAGANATAAAAAVASLATVHCGGGARRRGHGRKRDGGDGGRQGRGGRHAPPRLRDGRDGGGGGAPPPAPAAAPASAAAAAAGGLAPAAAAGVPLAAGDRIGAIPPQSLTTFGLDKLVDDQNGARWSPSTTAAADVELLAANSWHHFWVELRVGSFIERTIERRPATSTTQFLAAVVELLGLFTGICIYTIVVLPAQMVARKKRMDARAVARERHTIVRRE